MISSSSCAGPAVSAMIVRRPRCKRDDRATAPLRARGSCDGPAASPIIVRRPRRSRPDRLSCMRRPRGRSPEREAAPLQAPISLLLTAHHPHRFALLAFAVHAGEQSAVWGRRTTRAQAAPRGSRQTRRTRPRTGRDAHYSDVRAQIGGVEKTERRPEKSWVPLAAAPRSPQTAPAHPKKPTTPPASNEATPGSEGRAEGLGEGIGIGGKGIFVAFSSTNLFLSGTGQD